MKKPSIQDKEQIQEEVLLYKPYNVNSLRPKTSKPTFIQDEINDLKKYIKFMQAPIKTVPFYPPSHYKSIQPQGEQDEQYWNKIAIKFLKRKHNVDIIRKRFPIKMYIGGPPHEPYSSY